jgi:hypothetical protein
MASFTKINKFALNIGKKVFDLSSDQLKVALTNTIPDVSTANQYSDLTSPLATTNLSGATPFNITTTSYTQTSGTANLKLVNLSLTATGSVGPFQYIVVYDDTATNKELICFYDNGSAVTLGAGDTFNINFDSTNGLLSIA